MSPVPAEWTKTTSPLAKTSSRRGGGLERRIVAVAETHGGVIDLAQLETLGLSASAVRDRVRAGRLHRRYPGVYAVGRPDLSRDGRWWAAVLACRPDAFLSHGSAATADGLLQGDSPVIHVTVSPARRPRHRGVRVHRAELSPADVVTGDGVPRTSVARTLLDLAAVAPGGVLEAAVRRADPADLRILDERLPEHAGRRGVRVLRAALEAAGFGDGQPSGELERRFLTLCRRHGLPSPLVNQWMPIPGEEMKVDFMWPGSRLIVETDGFETHGGRQAFVRDRRRDQVLSANGWRVIRLTWGDVVTTSARTADLLRRVLDAPTRQTPAEWTKTTSPLSKTSSRRDGGGRVKG